MTITGRSSNLFHKINLASLALVVAVLVAVPIATLPALSMLGWDLSVPDSLKAVGFANYSAAIADMRFIKSILVTLYLALVPTALQMLFGFGLALALYEKLRFREFFKALFLIPMVIPPVVAGLVWKMLFIPGTGGVNYLLECIGMRGPDWLTSPGTALNAIAIASVWEWTPFVTLLLLAALESLPVEPLEGARIDGASYWQTVRFVIIPMIRPTLLVAFLFRLIEGFRPFPLIFMMTQGGPGTSTESMDFYAYLQGFTYYKIGYSSALSTIIFLLVLLLVCLPLVRRSTKLGEGVAS